MKTSMSLLSILGILVFCVTLGVSQQNINHFRPAPVEIPARSGNLKTLMPMLMQEVIKTRFGYFEVGCYLTGGNVPACTATSDPDAELFVRAKGHFERFEFEQAMKSFRTYNELHPNDERSAFYLALTQLYRGSYGSATARLSQLNKLVALQSNPSKSEFLDDIRFYFAMASLMSTNGTRIARTLFTQLNYVGGKYEHVSQGMINLL